MDLNPKEITKIYKTCVVEIKSYDQNNVLHSKGSGVVLKSKGIIITNFHIIKKGQDFKIKYKDNVYKSPELLTLDREKDIAIINLQDPKSFGDINYNFINEDSVGEKIYAIGFPQDYGYTVTDGIISGINRKLPKSKFNSTSNNFIQITAPISEGCSGGALINSKGELIGIITCTDTRGNNLNFAIPIAEVLIILDKKNKWNFDKSINNYYQKYQICLDNGNFKKARLYIEECLKSKENELFFLSKKAQILTKSQNYDEAINILENIIPTIENIGENIDNYNSINPKEKYKSKELNEDYNLDTLYHDIGLIHFLNNNYSLAVEFVNKGLELKKYSAELCFLKSKIYFAEHDYPEALNYSNKSIQYGNENFEYYNWRAECFLVNDNSLFANKDIQRAIFLNPENYYSYRLLGDLNFGRKKYQVALENYNFSLCKKIPSNEFNNIESEILEKKCYCYLELLKFGELKTIAQQIIQLGVNLCKGYYLESLAFYHLREFNESFISINKSIQISGTSEAFYYRSILQFHSKNFKEALTDINKALRFDYKNIDYLLFRNKILESINQNSINIDKFILENDSILNNFKKLVHFGENYVQKNDFEKAKKYFNLATEVDNLSNVDMITLATRFNSIGDFETAIKYISEAIEKVHDNSYLYLIRIGYLLNQNKYREVANDLTILINRDPENPDYYNYRWAIYFEMELYSHAIQDLEKLIILQPDQRDDLYSLIKSIRKGPTYMKLRNLMTRIFKKITGLKDEDFE